MIPPHFAHLPGDMQLFPNCPDFFPLFILPTPKGVFYSHPVLFRDALSWLILLLRKVLSYNREETAPLVLKQIFMWNLTSTLMFSKTISHITFWGRFSRKSGFVSYHLWSVSLSYLLYCHLFHHFHHVFFYSKECQSPFFWAVSGFSHGVYTHYPSYSFKQAHIQWLVSQNASDSPIPG